MTALSWQAVPALAEVVEPGVLAVEEPGVIVVEASGVAVSGVAVDRDMPGRVGGRVEVTKLSGVRVAICGARLTQDARNRLPARMHVQSLFMQ
jgi:hypothetical protein